MTPEVPSAALALGGPVLDLLGIIGSVSLPTILGYGILLRLAYQEEILRHRVGAGLAAVCDLERGWKDGRSRLPNPSRKSLRRAIRGGPSTPLVETLACFSVPASEQPSSGTVKDEFRLQLDSKFGVDSERLLDVGAAAPVWGVFWTLAGISIGALSLGLGGGLGTLLLSFSVAVGTSLVGHSVGHRARQVLLRLDAYGDLGAVTAAREVRQYFALPEGSGPRSTKWDSATPLSAPSEEGNGVGKPVVITPGGEA